MQVKEITHRINWLSRTSL